MRHGANAVIVGRKYATKTVFTRSVLTLCPCLCRLDRLTAAAEELSKDTGRTCIPAQADVRQPKALQDAVAKAIEKFGRIDFVICGMYTLPLP